MRKLGDINASVEDIVMEIWSRGMAFQVQLTVDRTGRLCKERELVVSTIKHDQCCQER